MENLASGYVQSRASEEIGSVIPLLSGFPLQTYVRGGLLSGWTSGLLSGYGISIVSMTVTSGILTLQLQPIATNDEHVRFLVVFFDSGMDRPITVWESTSAATIKEDFNEICHWLFKRR